MRGSTCGATHRGSVLCEPVAAEVRGAADKFIKGAWFYHITVGFAAIRISQIGGSSDVVKTTTGSEVTVGDYRDGEPMWEVGRRLPGTRKASSLTLRRGMTRSKKLLDWCQAALKGEKKLESGLIVLLDDARQVKLRWRFSNAVPVKCEGPGLQATGNDVAIETLEITCEGLALDRK